MNVNDDRRFLIDRLKWVGLLRQNIQGKGQSQEKTDCCCCMKICLLDSEASYLTQSLSLLRFTLLAIYSSIVLFLLQILFRLESLYYVEPVSQEELLLKPQ